LDVGAWCFRERPSDNVSTRFIRFASSMACVTTMSVTPFLAVQLNQQLSERGGGGLIQRAGGFVREQQLRAIDERADDGGALAFPAGKLAGAMVQAFAEPTRLSSRSARAAEVSPSFLTSDF
jgi:hypothetical protein